MEKVMSINQCNQGVSKIKWTGVEVEGPYGKKNVKLSGDNVEKEPKDSFVEGVGKGVAVGILGGAYNLLVGAYKSVEGYNKVYKAAKKVGLDDWEAAKVGLKGALVGGVRGIFHGILDGMVISSLIGIGGLIGGPAGAIIVGTVGAGFYNLVKDIERKE